VSVRLHWPQRRSGWQCPPASPRDARAAGELGADPALVGALEPAERAAAASRRVRDIIVDADGQRGAGATGLQARVQAVTPELSLAITRDGQTFVIMVPPAREPRCSRRTGRMAARGSWAHDRALWLLDTVHRVARQGLVPGREHGTRAFTRCGDTPADLGGRGVVDHRSRARRHGRIHAATADWSRPRGGGSGGVRDRVRRPCTDAARRHTRTGTGGSVPQTELRHCYRHAERNARGATPP
jgi:hypothetical protein